MPVALLAPLLLWYIPAEPYQLLSYMAYATAPVVTVLTLSLPSSSAPAGVFTGLQAEVAAGAAAHTGVVLRISSTVGALLRLRP